MEAGTKALILLISVITWKTAPGYVLANSDGGWQNKQADVYFLLDSSSSVWIDDFKEMLHVVNDLVDDMDVRPQATRVGIGVFSDQHTMHIPVNNNLSKEALKRAILETPCIRGDTYISRALQGMLEEGLSPKISRNGVPRIGVIITDGKSRHKQLTQDNATLAKKEGIFLFTVGVGPGVDRDELLTIASDPKNDYAHHVVGYNSLKDLKGKLSTKLSEVEFLQGDKSDCGGTSRVDTVFVYDEAAMGHAGSAKVKAFISSLVDYISMDSGNMRVGVVSKTCHIGDIPLGQYLKRSQFKSGLQQRSGPGMSDLFARARTESFRTKYGARLDAQRRIVLIMEGEGQDQDMRLRLQGIRAKKDGTEVFVISLGSSYNKELMILLASTEQHFLPFTSVDDLETVTGQRLFRAKFCERL